MSEDRHAMDGYWYLHENGELIWKNAYVVDSVGAADYFDSPFVRRWWYCPAGEPYPEELADLLRRRSQ